MRNALFAASIFLFASFASAQPSAVIRSGDYIDQYNISDPGNASGFDNNRVYLSHRVTEAVIQESGAPR